MEEGKHARVAVLALAVLIGVGLTSISALSVSASPNGIVTVCPSGPPVCDHQTIQEGIDAVSAGDTVLVSPAVYTEQVTLKSGVILESSDGSTATIITAMEGPIITASGITSASVQGFTIRGQGAMTTAVGIELSNSDLAISSCVIGDLYGADGDESHPGGWDAAAVRSIGGRVFIYGTTVQHISGGDGAEGDYWDGGPSVNTGGHAVGIQVQQVKLIIYDSRFVGIVGGEGGFVGGPCGSYAEDGASVSIWGIGGVVALHDSQVIISKASGSVPRYGIRTFHTSETYLKGNTITSTDNRAAWSGLRDRQADIIPDSSLVPCLPPLGSDVIAVNSEGDAILRMFENLVEDLSSSGRYGEATGVLARNVGQIELIGNSIKEISGGYGLNVNAAGMWVDGAEAAEISANMLNKIQAEDGTEEYFFPAWDGGGVVGIKLATTMVATIANNSIGSLVGGNGGNCVAISYCYEGGVGGDAVAFDVLESSEDLRHNVFYRTTPGDGGSPNGQPGKAIGLCLAGNADVLAINNALIDHGVGISSTSRNVPILDYNDLWDNDADYAGVPPGANDLHVPPDFVDAANGDFHLLPGSPLIDAGTNAGTLNEDFEGEPRPLDGNDDGVPIADIGADEYWPGLAGSVKAVIAASGDTLTYQMTLVNQSSYRDLSGVVLTDVLPVGVTYVTGTLAGSAGTWGHAEGMITWTGTVSAGQVVTLTYGVMTEGDPAVPYAVVNQAVLDDRIGKTRVLQAITLVNPLRSYLPIVFRYLLNK